MLETGRKVTMKEDMKGEVSEGSVDEVVWKWIARGGCACKKGTFFFIRHLLSTQDDPQLRAYLEETNCTRRIKHM